MSEKNVPRAFNIFLSHSYQSPDANLYFFQIFSKLAEVQFDVDVGKKSTNVTRLERLIRRSDGFIGVYPFTLGQGTEPTREQLLDASRYFRLELRLAAQARKPILLCVDSRYRSTITAPAWCFVSPFDHREIAGGRRSPNQAAFAYEAERFFKVVASNRDHLDTWPARLWPSKVGILLPQTDAYTALRPRIEQWIREASQADTSLLAFPTSVDDRFLAEVDSLDWIAMDISAESVSTGIPGYVEGRSIPILRLLHRSDPTAAEVRSPLEDVLYGSVGYPKDILRWSSEAELEKGLKERIARIYEDPERIANAREAKEYFRRAVRRDEPIFISYAGGNAGIAARIAEVFRQRFRTVFDYRDRGESIKGGDPWLEQISTQLQRSKLGVILLSGEYLESENCMQEARMIIAARNEGKMQALPVKVTKEELTLPGYLSDLQYLRLWETAGEATILEHVLRLLEQPRARTAQGAGSKRRQD